MFGLLERKLRKVFGARRKSLIDPDEVFLDASNLPEFDTHQFEGRIERPIPRYMFAALGIMLILVGALFTGQLWKLQVIQGEAHAAQSENNRLESQLIFAERGIITDRNGKELAWNVPYEDEAFARRAYRETPGLAHVLGYTQLPRKDSSGNYFKIDSTGLAGIEKAYDDVLAGVNGRKIVETDALGELLSESVTEPPQDGDSLALTVDARLQEQLYNIIASLADERSYQGGAAVLMDVTNGAVLSLVSYPEYDPNVLSDGEDSEAIGRYLEGEGNLFLNRAIGGLYPPGSTIKPFVALGALEEGVISPEKEILSTGSLRLPHPYIEDAFTIFPDWKAHGYTDMRRAIAVSSDVYFYTIGGGFEDQDGIGIAGIEKYARLFDIGEKSNLALPGEQDGVIPNPEWKRRTFDGEDWYLGNTYHTAIGQYGFQVTPLQMARATAALANGGTLYTPTLVKDERVSQTRIPVSKENLVVIQEGMRDTVTEGTGTGLSVPYVRVAGKTGTAQAGAQKEFINSWVIGYFPYDKPRYAFAVLMDRGPEHNTVGGVYVMRQLLDWMNQNTPEYFE